MNSLAIAVTIAQLAGKVLDNLEADKNKEKVISDVEQIDALARDLIKLLPTKIYPERSNS